MPTSILDSLRRMVTPSMVSQLSGLYGAPAPAIEKGLTAAIPAILAPLATLADDRNVMSQVFALVKDPAIDLALIDSPDRLIERAKVTTSDPGIYGRFQSLVFGSGVTSLTEGLSRFAGLRASTTSSLLALVTPLALSCLNRIVREEKLDANGLARRLAGEKSSILSALPAGLSQLVTKRPAITAEIPRATRAYDRDVEDTVAGPASVAARSAIAWVIPALLALLAVGGLYAMLRSNRPTETTRLASTTPAAVGTSGYVSRSLPGGADLRFRSNGTEARLLASIEGSAPITRDTWFEFDRLNFETDSARLRADSREQLENVASILKAYPQVRVKIGGYTDNSGDPASNRRLSEARAIAVMNGIKDLGVGADRLEAEGYGDQHPIGDNSTPEGRAMNRRVAISVIDK
jgi:OmpA-OmpF porin, OOP family